jgi:CheY-like chemotaxis protein
MTQNKEITESQGQSIPTSVLGFDVLLIDDDPVFCETMVRHARRYAIHLTTCQRASDLYKTLRAWNYDAIICDYHLDDDVNGAELVPLFEETPIVLVSRTRWWSNDAGALPASVNCFVHKKYGANAILEEAIRAATGNLSKH